MWNSQLQVFRAALCHTLAYACYIVLEGRHVSSTGRAKYVHSTRDAHERIQDSQKKHRNKNVRVHSSSVLMKRALPTHKYSLTVPTQLGLQMELLRAT